MSNVKYDMAVKFWKTCDIKIKCQIIMSNIKYVMVVKFGATHNNMDVKCEVWYGW